MTDLHPWVYNLVLVMLGVVTLAWLVWCLKGDRAKGRKRCPHCWYDLGPQATAAVLEGLRRNGWLARIRRTRAWKSEAAKGNACGVEPAEGADMAGRARGEAKPAGAFICCPECGTTVTRVRQLKRSKRRPRLALLAVVPVLIGSQIAMFPLRPDRGWTRWVPTTVLMAMRPTVDDPRAWDEFNARYLTQPLAYPFYTARPGWTFAKLRTPPESAGLSGQIRCSLLLRLPLMKTWQLRSLFGNEEFLDRIDILEMVRVPTRAKAGEWIEVDPWMQEQSRYWGRILELTSQDCRGITCRDYVMREPEFGCGFGAAWPRIRVRAPIGASEFSFHVRAELRAVGSVPATFVAKTGKSQPGQFEFPIGEAECTFVYRACEDDPGWYELQN